MHKGVLTNTNEHGVKGLLILMRRRFSKETYIGLLREE